MTRMHRIVLAAVCLWMMAWAAYGDPAPASVEKSLDVAPVWSGHPVGFALLTQGNRQYVAFYDAKRQMTVASRQLDQDAWQFTRLPSTVGWDSHNYVTMAMDEQHQLHVSGNMHCVPLVYFRTTRPYDASSLERIPAMTGQNEARCTYPRFLRGAGNELLFTYRDGRSGNGEQIWNVYQPSDRTWRRLLDRPLFSGQGKMNAYFAGPVRDRAGMFHLCWVWRDTPDCATNHDLCYARSKDLVHWETSGGRPLELPIVLSTAEVVDPVPAGGGMINGNTVLGFDGQDRPIISYHKFDAAGKTQIYNARREPDGWKIHQASRWDYRWEFHGGGSIGFGVHVGPVECRPDGTLVQNFGNPQDGSGLWTLNAATLAAEGRARAAAERPGRIGKVESSVPGMSVRTCGDAGQSDEPGVQYLLRWETRPPNRDRPYEGDPPPPSMLRVYQWKTGVVGKKM